MTPREIAAVLGLVPPLVDEVRVVPPEERPVPKPERPAPEPAGPVKRRITGAVPAPGQRW